MSDNMYMEMIHCQSPDEVYATVRRWMSLLSDHEHLVRSTILDIHMDVERVLKMALYQALLDVIFHGDDEAEYECRCEQLEKMVMKMSYSYVYRLLTPAFDAFPADDLAAVMAINEVRNSVAHNVKPEQVQYKGRSPFTNADCLAQLYLDSFDLCESVEKFIRVMVVDPRGVAKHHADFYHENYTRLKDDQED